MLEYFFLINMAYNYASNVFAKVNTHTHTRCIYKRKAQIKYFSECLLRFGILRVFVLFRVLVLVRDIKLDIFTLFTSFFL